MIYIYNFTLVLICFFSALPLFYYFYYITLEDIKRNREIKKLKKLDKMMNQFNSALIELNDSRNIINYSTDNFSKNNRNFGRIRSFITKDIRNIHS